jgi:hypothetical protein
MVKSFLINESGFIAPWTALSWSWVAGILAGAATLFGTVSSALAETCEETCRGLVYTVDCVDRDCEIECIDNGTYCECFGSCT